MLISNTSELDFELEQAAAPGPRAGGTLFSLILILAILAANAGAPGVTSAPNVANAPSPTSTPLDLAGPIESVTPATDYDPFRFGN